MKRVGIYARVSSLDQSTEMQVQELREYCKARGWELTMVCEDKASGTTDKRPQLQALMSAASQRKIDIVLVWKLDRFARSLKDLIKMLGELRELGIEFISLRDSIDLTTAQGRLLAQLLGAFAEFEASLIRERVRAGLRNAIRKGKKLGRKPTVNVARVQSLRSKGQSLSEIARAVGCTRSAVSKTLKKAAR